MKSIALVVTGLVLGICNSHAQSSSTNSSAKPVIYNRITKEGAPHDEAVRKAFDPKYTVIDLTNSAGYIPPKPIAGGLPKVALSESGDKLSGRVVIAYLISTNGYVKEAVVLNSTDDRLNVTALKATESWRFEPARLNGMLVTMTAGQEFRFKIQ